MQSSYSHANSLRSVPITNKQNERNHQCFNINHHTETEHEFELQKYKNELKTTTTITTVDYLTVPWAWREGRFWNWTRRREQDASL